MFIKHTGNVKRIRRLIEAKMRQEWSDKKIVALAILMDIDVEDKIHTEKKAHLRRE
jgi:hypothetical protein